MSSLQLMIGCKISYLIRSQSLFRYDWLLEGVRVLESVFTDFIQPQPKLLHNELTYPAQCTVFRERRRRRFYRTFFQLIKLPFLRNCPGKEFSALARN